MSRKTFKAAINILSLSALVLGIILYLHWLFVVRYPYLIDLIKNHTIEFLTTNWYYFSGLYVFMLWVLASGWICLRMHARSLVDDVEVDNASTKL